MKKILAIIILSATIFCGCKKGDEDPEFSIYTRQKRLVGTWNLSQLTSITSIKSNNSDSIFTKTLYGNSYIETDAADSSSKTKSGTLTVTLEIKDDGTYNYKEIKILNGILSPSHDILNEKWEWNDKQQKTAIIFKNFETFTITGLHKNQLVLTQSVSNNFGAYSITDTERWVFIK